MDFERADALNRAIRLIGIKHRARAAAALAELGLHPGQEVLLLELDAHGPRTQTQLAAGLGCEPPSVTLMARKLELAGLITRRPSPQDGRATVVELSDQGRAVIPRLKASWRDLADRTVADFAVVPVDELIEALTELAHSLQTGDAGTRLTRR